MPAGRGVPIVYLVATRPGWYRANYPCYVDEDDLISRRVRVTLGAMLPATREPVFLDDPIERRYRVHEVRLRLHQGRVRGVVLTAYRDRCAICRLKETRLLDAAHIVGDVDPTGEASVQNGLSLCTIHHRAYDEGLVGVAPDYTVHVARRLREDEDGPMLELLKGFHGARLDVPRSPLNRPDPDRLASRFNRFEIA